MIKKIIPFTLVLISFSCITVDKNSYTVSEDNEITESYLTSKQMLSDNVLLEAEPSYSDFASLILDLIVNKNWDEILFYSDSEIYNPDYKISAVDSCMYILNTGAEGSTTNYSLNDILQAYYTKTYIMEDKTVFQGEYLYPTGETEQFKLILKESETDYIITRE